MKNLIYCMLCVVSATSLAAEKPADATIKSAEPAKTAAQVQADVQKERSAFDTIPLPEKDSTEYWLVRSEAMNDLLPFLTKKRAEMKEKRELLANYLLKIGKAEDMAAQNIEVPEDPKLYARAMGVLDGLEEKNVTLPSKLPTWEETAQMAMRFVIDGGYVITVLDGEQDVKDYAELCVKKEAYARKVQKEMRGYAKDVIRIWMYLGTINEQDGCKAAVAQYKIDQKKIKDTEKELAMQQKSMAVQERSQSAKQAKFEDAQDRASFRSTAGERRYDTRQDQLQYQQTLLNERYTNAYRW